MAQGPYPYQSPQVPPGMPGYPPPPRQDGTTGLAIAAGVLMIVVSLIDLFGGYFYALGGSAVSDFGMAVQDGNFADDAKADAAAMRATGTSMQILGYFLMVMFGLGIAAAVVLFMGKAAMFALAVGVLQLIADGASCALLSHIGVMNILGFITAILVIAGALSISKKPAQYAPAM